MLAVCFSIDIQDISIRASKCLFGFTLHFFSGKQSNCIIVPILHLIVSLCTGLAVANKLFFFDFVYYFHSDCSIQKLQILGFRTKSIQWSLMICHILCIWSRK